MSEPAPPAERPVATTPRAAALGGLLRGLVAFAIVAGICTAIGLIEYAGSGGRYHTWTWVKVGFLYLLSSCDVALRALVVGHGPHVVIIYRVPLLAGMALILWLVARAARRAIGEDPVPGATAAGAVAAALGFAIPGALVALPANLRFPTGLPFQLLVSPVRWQAAVFVPAVSAAGALVGVFLARRHAWDAPRVVAWVEGGARMFAVALLLAFVVFLVAAALRPSQTNAYVRTERGWGRTGVVAATHHLLLLPDQSVWLLAPWMGGTTRALTGIGNRPLGSATLTLRQISLRGWGASVADGPRPPRDLAFDAAAWLFLLVPAAATMFGGWAAGRAGNGAVARVALGVGSGVVFAVLMTLAAWLSRAALPFPPVWLSQMTIRVAMPSTALLALAWGVVGGGLGAFAAGLGTGPQEPAEPEPD